MNVIIETLENKDSWLKGGTMVHPAIVHAPPSTRNQDKKRSPEMHQAKKGNRWYFGMKIHVGAHGLGAPCK